MIALLFCALASQVTAKELDEAKAAIERLELRLYNAELDAVNARYAKDFFAAELADGKPREADATLAVLRRLKMKMVMCMDSAPLSTILKFIGHHAGVPVKHDAALDKETLTIKVKDLSVESTLKLTLHPRGYALTVTPRGELHVARPADAPEEALDPGTLLDYLAAPSGEPTAEDRRRIEALLPQFDSDEIDARDRALVDIQRMGRRAWRLVESLDWKGRTPEGSARFKQLRERIAAAAKLIDRTGLERDVPALLRFLPDARIHERLKRILSGAGPFSTAGFPKAGPGLAEYLRGWWTYAGDGLRWNADKDAYEPK